MKPAKCDNQAYFFFKQRRYAFFRVDKIYTLDSTYKNKGPPFTGEPIYYIRIINY